MNARQLKALQPKKALEKDLEKDVCKYIESLGGYQRKFTSPSQRSVPDRLFVINGSTAFIELKRKGEVPTKAQRLELEALLKAGAVVSWSDNIKYAKEFIDMVAFSNSRTALHAHCQKVIGNLRNPHSDVLA